MKKLTEEELEKMRCRIIDKLQKVTARNQNICDKQNEKAEREYNREMKRVKKLEDKLDLEKALEELGTLGEQTFGN